MEKVHISQIYPTTEVHLGSELYYLCQLGFYLRKYDKELDLDGVVFNSILQKSDFWNYFQHMVREGYIVGTNLINIPQYIDISGIFTKDLTLPENEPVFKEKTDAKWYWTVEGNNSSDGTKNDIRLNGSLRSQAFVSMAAMVAVHRFMTGKPEKLVLSFSSWVTYQEMGVADIMLLYEETGALNKWVQMKIDEELKAAFEAWFYERQQKGYFKGPIASKDKLQYLKNEGIGVGDPVFFYVRDNKRKNDIAKPILDCHVGIIRALSAESITVDVILVKETKYTCHKIYEAYSDEVKALFDYHDPSEHRQIVRTERLNLLDVGVDSLMYKEEYFISSVNKQDEVVLEDKGLDGGDCSFALNPQQATYWLLKDWGIEFNDQKYIRTYLKEGQAVYDIYKKKLEEAEA